MNTAFQQQQPLHVSAAVRMVPTQHHGARSDFQKTASPPARVAGEGKMFDAEPKRR